jgi:hypothetical protein
MDVLARPLGPHRVDAGAISTERWLGARLNARHFRSLRLSSLQVLVVASLPLWAQAHGLRVPGWLAWLSSLVVGLCLALAVAYAMLEHRWSRRARLRAHSPRVDIQIRRTLGNRLRVGLWCLVAALSLMTWARSGVVGRPLPASLLGPLTLFAAASAATLLVTEMIRCALRLEAGAFQRIVEDNGGEQPRGTRWRRAGQRLDDAS